MRKKKRTTFCVIAGIIVLVFFAGCANQGRHYTLEELGETIAAAGEFWNDWEL